MEYDLWSSFLERPDFKSLTDKQQIVLLTLVANVSQAENHLVPDGFMPVSLLDYIPRPVLETMEVIAALEGHWLIWDETRQGWQFVGWLERLKPVRPGTNENSQPRHGQQTLESAINSRVHNKERQADFRERNKKKLAELQAFKDAEKAASESHPVSFETNVDKHTGEIKPNPELINDLDDSTNREP